MIPLLRPVASGQAITAEDWNRLIAEVQRLSRLSAATPLALHEDAGGYHLSLDPNLLPAAVLEVRTLDGATIIPGVQRLVLNQADGYVLFEPTTGEALLGFTGGGAGSLTGCKVTLSGAVNLPHNTVVTINWNTELFDSGAYHDNAVNPARLTVSQPGIYLTGFQLTLPVIGAIGQRYERISAQILKNGTTALVSSTQQVQDFANEAPLMTPSGVSIVSLTTSDYLQVNVLQRNAASSTNNTAAGETFSNFWIHQLG